MVDVSKRSGVAAAASDAGGRDGERTVSVHGSRPAWSRGPEANIRLHFGRQSGEFDADAWPERDKKESEATGTPSGTISMMDTIRVARAFFGQTPAEERADEPEPATAAEEPADEPEPVAATARENAVNVEQANDVLPTIWSTLFNSDAVNVEQANDVLEAADAPQAAESMGDEEDSVPAELLLDEIACEIVEDALLDREYDDPYRADAGTDAAVEAFEDPSAETTQLILEEEDEPAGETAPVLIVDDVAQEVIRPKETRAEAGHEETPAAPDAAAASPDLPLPALAAGDKVPLRRDRRAGPRLPIDGLAPSRSEAIARLEKATRAVRGPGQTAPKWSESARHHMSDLLASAARDTPAFRSGRIGSELPRIDTRPERHRQSSAMILLGLPAMLMIGFGGAYVYHASNYDPSRMFNEARNALPASIASVPTIVAEKRVTKITESIIQKQQARSAAAEPEAAPVATKSPLPPPVAPPVEEPAAAEQATAETGSSTGSITLTKAVSRAAPPEPVSSQEPAADEPEPRIEPAAAAVTAALSLVPAETAANPSALPEAVAPEQVVPVTDAPPAEPAPVQAEAEVAAPQQPTAKSDPSPDPTRLAALVPPAQPLPEQPGETGQLIARGNERMKIGDIAAARLLFELAAQSGSAVAATAMGRSYDPVYFLRAGVRGVKPDAEKAREWYEKAQAGGDETAVADLRTLTAWLAQQ